MKTKTLLIPTLLLLSIIFVNAECGDSFCDANEDCATCSTDCLCTSDKYGERVNCTVSFDSQECEKGYCKDKWCSTLEAFSSIFQGTSCSNNGSVILKIKFQELNSVILTPEETLKVYMKRGDASTFDEIKGVWYNPSKEGDFRYKKIGDTSNFFSEESIFKAKGDYYIRVKYKVGRSNILFEDKLVSCPGIPLSQQPEPETEPVTEPETPKEEPKTEPEEKTVKEEPVQETPEPKEPVQQQVKEESKTVEIKQQQGTSTIKIIGYIIGGLVIIGLILFFVKYELKIIKKI